MKVASLAFALLGAPAGVFGASLRGGQTVRGTEVTDAFNVLRTAVTEAAQKVAQDMGVSVAAVKQLEIEINDAKKDLAKHLQQYKAQTENYERETAEAEGAREMNAKWSAEANEAVHQSGQSTSQRAAEAKMFRTGLQEQTNVMVQMNKVSGVIESGKLTLESGAKHFLDMVKAAVQKEIDAMTETEAEAQQGYERGIARQNALEKDARQHMKVEHDEEKQSTKAAAEAKTQAETYDSLVKNDQQNLTNKNDQLEDANVLLNKQEGLKYAYDSLVQVLGDMDVASISEVTPRSD